MKKTISNLQAESSSNLPRFIDIFIKKCRADSNSLVLVTGVFDILHEEHEKFLRKASDLADCLIVGIESDSRVQIIKGESRPINNQEVRLDNLNDLKINMRVFILPNEFNKPQDHIDLIKKIKPNFLAVSSHTEHLDKKREIMALVGGEVVVIHNHNEKISSTKIIESRKITEK